MRQTDRHQRDSRFLRVISLHYEIGHKIGIKISKKPSDQVSGPIYKLSKCWFHFLLIHISQRSQIRIAAALGSLWR